MEKERKDLADNSVGRGVRWDDVADTEGHERGTDVDQEHTRLSGTLTGEGGRERGREGTEKQRRRWILKLNKAAKQLFENLE